MVLCRGCGVVMMVTGGEVIGGVACEVVNRQDVLVMGTSERRGMVLLVEVLHLDSNCRPRINSVCDDAPSFCQRPRFDVPAECRLVLFCIYIQFFSEYDRDLAIVW